MSTIDYKALAERVAQRAIYADNNADPNNKAWAADLRAVVSLLNGMADMEPAARIYTDAELVHRDPRWGRVCWIVPECELDGGALLYLHPAPQPQPRRPYGTDTMSEMGIVPMCDEPQPERQPLTNEQIDEIGEPFGYFTYGDAQGDKRRAFVRAIESSHGIGYGKAIEGGPSELRSCTCHPDDNPPVPCARQYALNECRAASEPTEAQIVAVADVLLAWEAEVSDRVPARVLAEDVLRAALAAKD